MKYEKPKLIALKNEHSRLTAGLGCTPGSSDSFECHIGTSASECFDYGQAAADCYDGMGVP